jgi:hypothetical protein
MVCLNRPANSRATSNSPAANILQEKCHLDKISSNDGKLSLDSSHLMMPRFEMPLKQK